MPLWRCAKCGAEFDSATKPACSAKPGCKNGLFVNPVVEKTEAYDHAAYAEEWHYQLDETRQVNQNYSYNSGGVHRPNGSCYIRGEWAISPDGSTHSSGRACWKVFRRRGNQWDYWGSYDGDLAQVNRGGGIREQQPPTN